MNTNGKKHGIKIKANYKPRDWADEFHGTDKRWRVLVCHRRSGKTTASLNHLIRDAGLNKNSRYAYIAPFYKQAKTVAWDMLKEYSRAIPNIAINESELRVDYPNGARVQLFGADNPDALRGLGLWGVVFDEYSQQPSSIFTEIIRPALSDHEGYAIWIGTPKGRNDFFRLYDEHRNDGGWYVRLLKASESKIIPQEELDDARKNMSLDEYNQEFECNFDAAIKGAYYSAQLQDARREGRICKVPYQEGLKVDTYWDLGISDYTCIIFVQYVGREIHIIDYYENNNLSLMDYAMELRKRNYRYGFHNLPHDANARELATGKSRVSMLQEQLGYESIRVVKNKAVKDGIESARKLFSRCWFDVDKTQLLLDALASYTQEWDDKKGMFRDQPLHNWASHASDSFRMLGVGFEETIEPRPTHFTMSKYKPRTPETIKS